MRRLRVCRETKGRETSSPAHNCGCKRKHSTSTTAIAAAEAVGQTSSFDGTTQAPAVDTSPPTAGYDWESYQAIRTPWWAQTSSGLAAAGGII